MASPSVLLGALSAIASGNYDPAKVLATIAADPPVHAHAPTVSFHGPHPAAPTPDQQLSAQTQSEVLPTMPRVEIQGRASKTALGAAALAEKFMGTPYVWGGERPGGFDCSGLLQYVWAQKGISIPRTTYAQFTAGRPVSKSQLEPGDAVFFTGSDPMNGLPGHVGMYVGGGRFIEAPRTGLTVRISNLAGRSDFVGARRYA